MERTITHTSIIYTLFNDALSHTSDYVQYQTTGLNQTAENCGRRRPWPTSDSLQHLPEGT